MSDYVLLPEAFVKYVTRFKRLPIPVDADVATVRSIVETVCLEESLGEGLDPSLDATNP